MQYIASYPGRALKFSPEFRHVFVIRKALPKFTKASSHENLEPRNTVQFNLPTDAFTATYLQLYSFWLAISLIKQLQLAKSWFSLSRDLDKQLYIAQNCMIFSKLHTSHHNLQSHYLLGVLISSYLQVASQLYLPFQS